MMDLYFHILLYILVLDGYRDFNPKTYIKIEKSAIVYGDVYESRALLPSFPILKDS